MNQIVAQNAWKNGLVARSPVYHEAFRRRESKSRDAQICFKPFEPKLPIRIKWVTRGRSEEAPRKKILKIASRNRHISTNIGVFPADTRKGLLEMVADCRRPTSQEISDGHYAFARRLNGLDRDLP